MLAAKIALADIARERDIKVGTVIDHIEKLKSLGELPDIDYLKGTLPERDFNLVLDEFRRSPDGKLSPVRQQVGNRFSWDDLRLVRLFV